MVASDKLFFWLFQERTDRLQPLVASVINSMEGYTFSAPAIKEREARLDGLFLPPPDQLPDKPALIMEAKCQPILSSSSACSTKLACSCVINTARACRFVIGRWW